LAAQAAASRWVAFAGNIFPAKNNPWEMRLSLGRWNSRTLIAGLMLVAFASRGLIPPGFMPASGRPFLMELCWEGLPADMIAPGEPSPEMPMDMESMGMESMPGDSLTSRDGALHGAHHRSGSLSLSEHCVFAAACFAGPIPHLPLPSLYSSAQQLRQVALASMAADVRVVYLPQPRAPPGRLS
jgi:hypothetical protein